MDGSTGGVVVIVSSTLKYVYIEIPRTGSKSIRHWLTEHYDGQYCGDHHQYDVPEEFRDYLAFTVVRNPYDRRASSYSAVTWDDQGVQDHELGPCRDFKERQRRCRDILRTRERSVQRELPQKPSGSLEQRVHEIALRGRDHGINQKTFVERAGVIAGAPLRAAATLPGSAPLRRC